MIKNLSLIFDTKIHGRMMEKDIVPKHTEMCNKVLDLYVHIAQNKEKWSEQTRVVLMKVMLGMQTRVARMETHE